MHVYMHVQCTDVKYIYCVVILKLLFLWSDCEVPELLPCGYLVGDTNITVTLKGG